DGELALLVCQILGHEVRSDDTAVVETDAEDRVPKGDRDSMAEVFDVKGSFRGACAHEACDYGKTADGGERSGDHDAPEEPTRDHSSKARQGDARCRGSEECAQSVTAAREVRGQRSQRKQHAC